MCTFSLLLNYIFEKIYFWDTIFLRGTLKSKTWEQKNALMNVTPTLQDHFMYEQTFLQCSNVSYKNTGATMCK